MANGNGNGKLLRGIAAVLAVVVAMIGSGFSGAYLAGSRRSATEAAIQQNTECRKDHEQRIRLIESTLSRMDANLEWIRQSLEK